MTVAAEPLRGVAALAGARPPLTIAVVYAVAGITWVLVGDALLRLAPDRLAGEVQSAKGIAFVVLSSLLVLTLTSAFAARARRAEQIEAQLAESHEQLLQAQRLETVGQLAGSLAHDLNNLLTVVVGYSALLREHPDLDAATRADVAEIGRAAEEGTALMRRLLAVARRDSRRPERLQLGAVVAETSRLLERLLGDRIRLRVESGRDVPDVVADRSQAAQLLFNLVANARDAMPDGGSVTIRTELALVPHGDVAGGTPLPHAVLSVADTGTGVDEAVRARIFEPFFTTKPPGQGTGLGLATVRGIVTECGGFVRLHTGVGRGARFEVFLPAACQG